VEPVVVANFLGSQSLRYFLNRMGLAGSSLVSIGLRRSGFCFPFFFGIPTIVRSVLASPVEIWALSLSCRGMGSFSNSDDFIFACMGKAFFPSRDLLAIRVKEFFFLSRFLKNFSP